MMEWIKGILIGIVVAIICFITNYLWNKYLKKVEEIDGEFRFDLKNNIIYMGLTNKGKRVVHFDTQKGVCIRWGDRKYHKINFIENDNTPSFIPPQGGTQLPPYKVNLNITLKNIISSRKFKLYIYTTRDRIFELHPSACQLNEWKMTMPQYKEFVKDI